MGKPRVGCSSYCSIECQDAAEQLACIRAGCTKPRVGSSSYCSIECQDAAEVPASWDVKRPIKKGVVKKLKMAVPTVLRVATNILGGSIATSGYMILIVNLLPA